MNQQQIKDFIAEKVPEGYSISKIQDMLKEQGVHITFMELRLLASEMEEQIWKQNEKEEKPASPEPEIAAPAEDEAANGYAAAPACGDCGIRADPLRLPERQCARDIRSECVFIRRIVPVLGRKPAQAAPDAAGNAPDGSEI